MNTNSLIVFVHVPKTGGTSLHALLEKNYPEQGMLFRLGHCMNVVNGILTFDIDNTHIKTFVKKVQSKKSLKYIGGHLPYGIHQYIDRPCVYVTILRDPFDRVQSLFRHVLRCENDVIYNYWHENYGFDCASILRSNDKRVCNSTTRMITGGKYDAVYAIELLKNKYEFVGILENIEPMIMQLAKRFQLEHSSFPHLNEDTTCMLSEEMNRLILNHNELDYAVYQEMLHVLSSS